VLCLSRHLRREETAKEDATRGLAALSSGPKLDLGFKEGQTITINMPVGRVSNDHQGMKDNDFVNTVYQC